ncbi:chloroplastic group IIA intron splicing facilitator CRS1, chloroplastic-like [Arachis stenosperma]|uniref:chloroplastic group IIA intron splicing facilitator CRS1, chloroplastic-like n=1 Tax=Arachis stenosperma TaxID=217475 RepID=UPI0025AD65F8|nr:chloroplastic group IIA intron splicing facilitator CRS1, chloroplastic-like [Arachis stenosperma]XP_057733672.1 chloroplastic group IIA intron splicing facilitator CRS1, chloroplastic-like [Arachis stenosperma]
MFFLSLHPHLSLNSSTHSYSYTCIFSSFNNNNQNQHHHHHPNSIPIPKDPNNSHYDASSITIKVKAPTPPWIKGPLLLQPHDVLDLSKPKNKRLSKRHMDKEEEESERVDKALHGKEVRGKKVMKRIARSIERLRRNRNSAETQLSSSAKEESFGGYLEKLEENVMVRSKERMPWERNVSVMDSSAKDKNFDGYYGKLEENGDDDEEQVRRRKRRMPWEKDEKSVLFARLKKEKPVTAADLTLDEVLLKRLRSEAAKMRIWVKVKKLGVTQDVVDEIKRTWRNNELAMLKFDIPLCKNMDRAREIVEMKTGGLVVWSRKDTHVVYRGCNYQLTSRSSPKVYPRYIHGQTKSPYETNMVESVKSNNTSDMPSGNGNNNASTSTCIQEVHCSGSLYERETDRLLDDLGPRFVDWWYPKPLPIDADLLPEVVPGFKPPFRLCPPYSSAKITDYELTFFRKLAKPLPVHFVLGRNRRLQGLAAAILKLWEKSLIAKIAIKFGIPNTDNELMANELKLLTGGVTLLRNKYYIILYRGNDFLPSNVASLVEERELELKSCQLSEEVARMRANEAVSSSDYAQQETSTSGTLTEFEEIQTKLEDVKNGNADLNIQLEAEIYRLERQLKEQQRKALIISKKIERSTEELAKLDAAWTPAEKDADVEIMTDEERQCFQKIGLKMSGLLVLGRRGIFDGVLEGLHQHWKHREVVKVITKQRLISRVIYTAKMLETESGGILVSVDKLKEGHAIIIYRGKNYKRPSEKVAKNLLTKRKALQRSLEMQRLGSLKFFAHQKQQTISDLKLKLGELQQKKEAKQRKTDN